ncbi:hypothetical protein [Nonomuraea sp. NPDC050786]|uniref:hypothetical protein n=1 Tax=Nonomuraea sp. NPDC050786 TaxID=3154840 RepID=UPI00340CE7BF
MIRNPWEQRSLDAAVFDAQAAVLEFDQARSWLRSALARADYGSASIPASR